MLAFQNAASHIPVFGRVRGTWDAAGRPSHVRFVRWATETKGIQLMRYLTRYVTDKQNTWVSNFVMFYLDVVENVF